MKEENDNRSLWNLVGRDWIAIRKILRNWHRSGKFYKAVIEARRKIRVTIIAVMFEIGH